MNRAIVISQSYPTGTIIEVPHIETAKPVRGRVVGCYSENRIGDLDEGIWVEVDGVEENYQVNLEYVRTVSPIDHGDLRRIIGYNYKLTNYSYIYEGEKGITVIEKKSTKSKPIDEINPIGYYRKLLYLHP